ncbi:hypothetical protein CYMTET_11264 [Cymbomonas tetramitiformis]|uniref:Uncharacterized protein n=1 Tax=Cymbomonas tetramitiformis TaxID=36881 RepID=A0AAE0LD65_9CHLO|nr:hypothetical protein CYMTET_11264 [Cymbomonas tetramitiformis]
MSVVLMIVAPATDMSPQLISVARYNSNLSCDTTNKIPAPPSAPQSVVSDEEMYPVSALHAHEPHVSFMDKFAVNLDLTGPEPTLAIHSMGTVAPVDSVLKSV